MIATLNLVETATSISIVAAQSTFFNYSDVIWVPLRFNPPVTHLILNDYILFNGCNYLSMLGLQSIDISKRGPAEKNVTEHG